MGGSVIVVGQGCGELCILLGDDDILLTKQCFTLMELFKQRIDVDAVDISISLSLAAAGAAVTLLGLVGVMMLSNKCKCFDILLTSVVFLSRASTTTTLPNPNL